METPPQPDPPRAGAALALRPVFIGGCGRSGTTLLGALLGAHSRSICVPESPFKTRLLRRAGVGTAVFDPARIWRELLGSRRLALWELELPGEPPAVPSYPALLEWLVRRYGERHRRPAVEVWIDHTPTNLRHAAMLGELFPSARFIHLVRDGRAVAASILPLDWGPSTIDAAARWWVESLAFGLGAESWGGPGRVLRVRYEDLVCRPAPTLERICGFLELEWEPALLLGGGFALPAYTLDQHRLAGGPPDPRRAAAWEDELASRAVEIFEATAGELLRYLGYAPRFGLAARPPSTAERLGLRLRALWRRAADRSRRRSRQRRIPGGRG